MENPEIRQTDAPKWDTRIGRVVSVSGSQVVCILDPEGTHDYREVSSNLQLGSLVKLGSATATILGLITAQTIPLPSDDPDEKEMQIFELVLIGEIPMTGFGAGAFRRGVSMMPSLSTNVYFASTNDLSLVYAPPSDAHISIGTIHQDEELNAHALTDEMVNKHFAILGTTGSGKSSATTVILKSLVKQNPNAHIILLDPHNEYSNAFADIAEVLTPKDLELPFWILNFDELLQVMFGGRFDAGSAEAEILAELIPAAKKDYLGDRADGMVLSVETPSPYRISDVVRRIENEMGKIVDAEDRRPYRRIRARFAALQEDARYKFMFGGFDTRDRMATILAKLFRIPVNGKPMSIVDLSGIPSEVTAVVVAVVGRLTFDFALWSDKATPIMLVCEEAHRYSPSEPSKSVEISARMLSKIAKEGRKYGVSLAVVSQRPSKLSSDLLSQCNTIFALRMSNVQDTEYIRGAISDALSGLMAVLPTLRNGEAIAVGMGVPVPYRMRFNVLQPHELPAGGTALVSEAWQHDSVSRDFVDEVVAKWRQRGAGDPVQPALVTSSAAVQEAAGIATEPAAEQAADDDDFPSIMKPNGSSSGDGSIFRA